ncbi:4-phosphoerythronate dehydrogenase [Oceanisphaera sp.]|uniref:4-phosphoerythronate dehydrogenase n=1 Tax=Oceanisphaera sp. TaxID=1929979 RepID=UPI003A943B72
MKLLADENMPYVQELFADWAEVVTCPGRDMTPEQLRDVDVLLVRSITRVDEALLANAQQLSFVGTATIGCDHIDTDLLARRGIAFASAPGCNKVAVGDYVLAALLKVAEHKGWQLAEKTLAVVGVGNTGSQVAARARALGMKVLLCDPPKAQLDPTAFVELAQALTADIVSFHVPFTREGQHATWHLLDEPAIAALHGEQVLINACRGDVWDNAALLQRQQGSAPLTLVMDVWEHEPAVLAPLVPHVLLATPHIAGYSLEGKARGTFALYCALCELQHRAPSMSPEQLLPPPAIAAVHLHDTLDQALIARLVRLVYDIEQDDQAFRAALGKPGFFDDLRKHYPQRRELGSLQLINQNQAAQELGFKVSLPVADS